MICRANQWTGFYMITASVMKELRKKDLLISFMKVTMEIKMFKSQKTKNSSDDKSDREVSDFLSSEDSCDKWLS